MRHAITDTDVLLVVDVQNDFCPGGKLAVPAGDEVVPLVNRLGERFQHVVLTQDWHPPGHRSFASAHPGRQPFETIAFPYGPQVLWPDHCVQGTPGAAIPCRTEGSARRADHSQGLSPRHRFLFGLLRERSQDSDGARWIPARARSCPRVCCRPRARLLRALLGRRRTPLRLRRRGGGGCLPRHRCRRLDGFGPPGIRRAGCSLRRRRVGRLIVRGRWRLRT